MVVVALVTALLFGFAALAVDVGHGMAERRRSQSAADAAALAAGVEVNVPGATLQDLVDEALAFADVNGPGPIPRDDWLAACPDSGPAGAPLALTAADLALSPPTECVSFDATLSRIRVSLPTRALPTFFAGVIGIDRIEVTAFAEATVALAGSSSTPPFVLSSGHSGGDQVCLRTSASSARLPAQFVGDGPQEPARPGVPGTDPPDPCDDTEFDPDAAFFGTIKAHTYADCKQPSGNQGIAMVIADGIDHVLGSFGDYAPGAEELVDGCTHGLPQYLPNTIEMQTGFTAQALELGLLSTTDTIPRLARANFQTTTTFAGQGMDNVPLWAYIRQDIGNADDVAVPDACRTVYAERANPDYDYFDLRELMEECLREFVGVPGEDNRIFAPAIADSPRFAWIPLIDEQTLGGLDGKRVHINAFVPVYLHKLYQQGKAVGTPDPFCFARHPDEKNVGWYMHEAGQETGPCGRAGQNVDRLAAIVLHCAALPDTICIDDTTSAHPGGRPVFRLELVR
jgi:hypothetical protein